MWTSALTLFIDVAAARIRRIKDEAVEIATTATFVLESGFTEQEPHLGERFLAVGVGVATGIAVNHRGEKKGGSDLKRLVVIY